MSISPHADVRSTVADFSDFTDYGAASIRRSFDLLGRLRGSNKASVKRVYELMDQLWHSPPDADSVPITSRLPTNSIYTLKAKSKVDSVDNFDGADDADDESFHDAHGESPTRGQHRLMNEAASSDRRTRPARELREELAFQTTFAAIDARNAAEEARRTLELVRRLRERARMVRIALERRDRLWDTARKPSDYVDSSDEEIERHIEKELQEEAEEARKKAEESARSQEAQTLPDSVSNAPQPSLEKLEKKGPKPILKEQNGNNSPLKNTQDAQIPIIDEEDLPAKNTGLDLRSDKIPTIGRAPRRQPKRGGSPLIEASEPVQASKAESKSSGPVEPKSDSPRKTTPERLILKGPDVSPSMVDESNGKSSLADDPVPTLTETCGNKRPRRESKVDVPTGQNAEPLLIRQSKRLKAMLKEQVVQLPEAVKTAPVEADSDDARMEVVEEELPDQTALPEFGPTTTSIESQPPESSPPLSPIDSEADVVSVLNIAEIQQQYTDILQSIEDEEVVEKPKKPLRSSTRLALASSQATAATAAATSNSQRSSGAEQKKSSNVANSTKKTTTAQKARARRPIPGIFADPGSATPSQVLNKVTISSPKSTRAPRGRQANPGATKAKKVDEPEPALEPEPKPFDGSDEEQLSDVDSDEPTYCFCEDVSWGSMIACENDKCEREWFHLSCVGLTQVPPRRQKWFCTDCQEELKVDQQGKSVST